MNVLTLDIETAPNKGYFWRLFKAYITTDQVTVTSHILSWSAKWLGSKAMQCRTLHDADMLTVLHELMCNADAIVTYNGDKFDLRHINREFAKAGLSPVRPSASIDLYKIVKATFDLPSYRLDYVCEFFLGERKLETGGFELWEGVMENEEKAWDKMKRYNKRDVVLTEKLYVFLKPWIKNHPYIGDVPDFPDLSSDYSCPSCGSHKVELERPRRTRCYAVRVVRCKDCGNWFDGKRKKL